jgi:hypothetical protein
LDLTSANGKRRTGGSALGVDHVAADRAVLVAGLAVLGDRFEVRLRLVPPAMGTSLSEVLR